MHLLSLIYGDIWRLSRASLEVKHHHQRGSLGGGVACRRDSLTRRRASMAYQSPQTLSAPACRTSEPTRRPDLSGPAVRPAVRGCTAATTSRVCVVLLS